LGVIDKIIRLEREGSERRGGESTGTEKEREQIREQQSDRRLSRKVTEQKE